MDHKNALRLNATERYLLNELDPDQLDQFEEHLFDCPKCALDLRAAAMFVEQGKTVLAEPGTAPQEVRTTRCTKSWFAWLPPAFAVPAMALLLLIVGYQNIVELPAIRSKASLPEIIPSATMNIATRGGDVPLVQAKPGQDFSLTVDLPPDGAFTSYIADLYNPAGSVEWSLEIPADAVVNDSFSVRVPGTGRPGGIYALAVHGVPRDSDSPSEIGRHSFELRPRVIPHNRFQGDLHDTARRQNPLLPRECFRHRRIHRATFRQEYSGAVSDIVVALGRSRRGRHHELPV